MRSGPETSSSRQRASLTPRALADQVDARFGARGAALAELLRTLDAQRYGRGAILRPSAPWLRALRGEVQTLMGISRNLPHVLTG